MNPSLNLKELLIHQQYQELVNHCEDLIENNPDETDNYWYLGLGYLLTENEEQAQLSWLMGLNQEEDIEAQTEKLISVLEDEANRLEKEEKYQQAWLIRGHIRELQPDNLSNLINLIWLDITLDNFDVSKLNEWQVIELLETVETPAKVPEELIIKVLDKILYIVAEDSINFARACLTHLENQESIINTIVDIAKYIADKHYIYTDHAANLVNVCREKKPDDLLLIKTLFWFYANDNYQKAVVLANEFLNKSTSLSTKIFGLYQLLYLYLKQSDWYNALSLVDDYLQDLNDFINSENVYIENFVAASLFLPSYPLFYIQDNPKTNRYLLNQFSSRFQSIVDSESSVKVNTYSNTLIKERPLHIGYIGHTFRHHSVGWLCRWLLHYHNPENFQYYIYSMTKYQDDLTEKWFIKKVNEFYGYDMGLREIVQQIQNDKIDILVDLDSLTLNTTCQIMGFKPAPIQVTWLGLDASGIPSIDYFIADPYVLPQNAQDYYSEKIWRLPHTYLGIDGFEVDVPTIKRKDLNIESDAIIFMNTQGALKRHPDCLRWQMRILRNVPNSYLLLKGKADQDLTQELYNRLAIEEGIDLDRLRFLKMASTEKEHRANLAIADVMLDTYPYNGSTTTLETLWMEIPIVTRVGKQFAARNSYTYLMNVGITEGIAWSDEEYVEWGIKLGTDENLRKEISWKLKQSKKTSPLWNGKQFAREMENAYRQMWEIYVKENS